jgi:acyl-CoA thioester hydrolase
VHVVVGKNMKKTCLPAKYAERFAAHLNSRASDS